MGLILKHCRAVLSVCSLSLGLKLKSIAVVLSFSLIFLSLYLFLCESGFLASKLSLLNARTCLCLKQREKMEKEKESKASVEFNWISAAVFLYGSRIQTRTFSDILIDDADFTFPTVIEFFQSVGFLLVGGLFDLNRNWWAHLYVVRI